MPLNDKQIQIAAEVMQGDKSVKEIMELYGYARETYYLWRKENKEFQDLLKEIEASNKEEALSILRANSHKAANVIINAITGKIKITKPRLDAARDLLDRIGLNPAIKYVSEDNEDPKPLDPNEIKAQMEARRLGKDLHIVEDNRDKAGNE